MHFNKGHLLIKLVRRLSFEIQIKAYEMSFIHHAHLIERKIESYFRDSEQVSVKRAAQNYRPTLGRPTTLLAKPLSVASSQIAH